MSLITCVRNAELHIYTQETRSSGRLQQPYAAVPLPTTRRVIAELAPSLRNSPLAPATVCVELGPARDKGKTSQIEPPGMARKVSEGS
jgi:hypothetical protein